MTEKTAPAIHHDHRRFGYSCHNNNTLVAHLGLDLFIQFIGFGFIIDDPLA
jgi:hypothetical protein